MPATTSATATITVVVATSPGATCHVKAKDRGGKLSLAAGLKKKQVADSTGTVSWTWTLDSSTAKGEATITVTCNLGPRSGSKDKVILVL